MSSSNEAFSTVIPFREFAEKGVSQARENYEKFKDVAQSGNETIEAFYASSTKGASDYSTKVLEIARTNTNSAFDLAQQLMSIKSPSEALTLWSTFARSQYETLTAQGKELAELGQKVTAEAVEPLKANASKVFSKVS
jgi:phasin